MALSRQILLPPLRSPWIVSCVVAFVLIVTYGFRLSECGPWDPWETHYGEVARNILVRGDPLDLWWKPGYGPNGRYETLFNSKHALPFWCMALSMKFFGVGTGDDPGEMVFHPFAEWSIRFPSLLLMGLSVLVVGRTVGHFVHWRAGIFSAIALATMPQLAMIGRQAITDIYFIAPMIWAMMAWAMAWLGPEFSLKTRGSGWQCIPWDRRYAIFLGLFFFAAIVPLAVLHVHVVDEDTITRVSKWRSRPGIPTVEDLAQISRHFFGYWCLVVLCLGSSLRWRSARQVYMGIVYMSAGLALMGKGLIGPGIIGLLLLSHLLLLGRWRILLRCGLPLGMVLFVLTCFPWHHAMAIFRGERWVNMLLIINNLQRFTEGEQPQAMGDLTYYLRTLSWAALPWVAVLPQVLLLAGHRITRLGQVSNDPNNKSESKIPRSVLDLHVFALLWLLVSFGVISVSVTKYYHYLAPCLPPLAILAGIWLDQVWNSKRESKGSSLEGKVFALLFAAVVLFFSLHYILEHPAILAHLTTYLYTGDWVDGAPPTTRLLMMVLPFGFGLVAWFFSRGRIAVLSMLLSAWLTTGYMLVDYMPAASENWSQREMMRVYFSQRKPKDELLSWWFFHRGETFLSKARVWMLVEADKQKLREYIEKRRGKGRTFWFITTPQHAKRLNRSLPMDMRNTGEVVYENFHHTMIRVPVP